MVQKLKATARGSFYFDKIIQLPKAVSKNFIRKSISIYKNYDLIIPTTEIEIKRISSNVKIYKDIKFLINNKKVINLFLDKLKTYNFLKNHNIGNLDFCEELSGNKIKRYPVFIKTKTGSGNKNYYLIKNFRDLKKLNIKNKNKYIFQEYVNSKKEFTACIYKNCKFTEIITFERILDKDKTFFAKITNNKKINDTLIALSKLLDFEGSINIQFKILKNKIKIFEINPRLSSTVLMRDLIGFKDCYWWISDILQLKYKKKNIKFNNKLKLLREEKIKIYE